MLKFIPASERPNRNTSHSSLRLSPEIRGRHSSASTSAANSTRRNTAPPGPTSSKIDLASAAPNCTDDTAPTTSAGGGTRSTRMATGADATWDYEAADSAAASTLSGSGAQCASGSIGVSRRYASASSAAIQPVPAAVTAWR